MLVEGVNADEILEAEHNTKHIRVHSLRRAKTERGSYRFVLKPKDSYYAVIDLDNGKQLPNAVNWYGHRDFFRALYALNPGAVVITAWDTYYGKNDFESRFHESANRKIAGTELTPLDVAIAPDSPRGED